MANYGHNGKIDEILELDQQRGYYAIVFKRNRHYYLSTGVKQKEKYLLIIGLFGKNGIKVKSGDIKDKQRVHVEFRISSKVDIFQGKKSIKQSVICVSIEDFSEYKARKKPQYLDVSDESTQEPKEKKPEMIENTLFDQQK